jgi:hypothetical protein
MDVKFYLIAFLLLISSIIPYSSGGILSSIFWVMPIYFTLKFNLNLEFKYYLFLLAYCLIVIIVSSFFYDTDLYFAPL